MNVTEKNLLTQDQIVDYEKNESGYEGEYSIILFSGNALQDLLLDMLIWFL